MNRGGRLRGAPGAGALALLALAGALAWQTLRPTCCAAPVAQQADAGVTRAPAPVRALANAPALARVAAPSRAWTPLDDDASDLRALLRRPPAQLREDVLHAQSRPADGGRLYARQLLRQCAAADAVAGLHAPEGDDPGRVAPPDATDPRAARALQRLQALRAACAQFTPAEIAAGLNILHNDADPLLALADQATASPADERALVRQALARPDPLLLQELGPRLAQHTVAGDPAYWFDGRRVAPEIAELALALLPCALGLPCDESDPQVWTHCLQGLGCAADREDLVLRAAGDDAQRRQQILALVRHMAQAVRAGEDHRFLPGPARPPS